MARWSKELSGEIFGRWTVIEKGPKMGKNASWKCLCSCGKQRNVAQFSLLKGVSTSCGCFFRENTRILRTKHNMCGTPEYNTWNLMIQRCTNKTNESYTDYGGRGISVCERWMDFNNFYDDMGSRPGDRFSIDRVDVNGNYEPSNCKWANDYEQARNKRVRKNNNSGHTGVHWSNDRRKWLAQINSETGKHYLGLFDVLEDAVIARKLAEIKYWGKSS